MVALGPAIGFLMGSLFVSEWINIGDNKNIDKIISSDPRWIGRWWGGFILSSSLLLVLSIILFTFPSNLKENNNQIKQNQSLCHLSNIKAFLVLLIDIFNIIINLIKNKTYILIVLINSLESVS